MPLTRSVLLHAHMFKNAGSTLDWSLQRCLGKGFADHRDDDAMRGSSAYLGTHLSAHPQIRALSSHWLPLPLTPMPGIKPWLVMLLRNPLERCRSVYNFERTQEPASSPGNKKARELCFTEYVKWRLQPDTGPVIKNFHTRFCSGDYFSKDMEQLFEQAVANLAATPLVGLVHRYSESMVLFEHHLLGAFPDLDLSWRVQNTSQASSEPIDARVDAIADELGDTFDSLVAANRYDIKLLQHAEAKLEAELSRILDLDARLRSIHQRNELL